DSTLVSAKYTPASSAAVRYSRRQCDRRDPVAPRRPGSRPRAAARPDRQSGRSRVMRALICALLLAAPPGLAAQTGHIYVSNERSGDVSVIDAATRKVVRTIEVGSRPRGIHLSPDGRRLYVALSDDSPMAEPDADAIAGID